MLFARLLEGTADEMLEKYTPKAPPDMPPGFLCPREFIRFEDFPGYALVAYKGDNKKCIEELKEKALFYAECRNRREAEQISSLLAYMSFSIFKYKFFHWRM